MIPSSSAKRTKLRTFQRPTFRVTFNSSPRNKVSPVKGGGQETQSDDRQVRKLIWSAEGWKIDGNDNPEGADPVNHITPATEEVADGAGKSNKQKTFFNCFPIRCENEENTRRRMCTRITDPQVAGRGTSSDDNRRHAAVAKQKTSLKIRREPTPLQKLIKHSSVSSVSGVASADRKTRKTSFRATPIIFQRAPSSEAACGSWYHANLQADNNSSTTCI